MPDLTPFTIAPTATIRAAMEKIDRNKHRVVVVVDDELRVLGTVSDGDIRRAFLKDVLAIARVEQIMNLNCRTTRERDPRRLAVIAQREKVTVLPLVDSADRLVDVFLVQEPFLPDSPAGGVPP